MRPDQDRVKKLLTEAVTLLCRNSLQFEEEVTVEGLLGITLDQRDIFLVSIRETVETTFRESKKRPVEEETSESSTPSKRRRDRRRRSSRDSQSPPTTPPPPPSKEDPGGLLLDVEDAQDENVKVKVERLEESQTDSKHNSSNHGSLPNQDSTHWQQDGRLHDPAHDPSHKQGQGHDRSNQNSSSSFSTPFTVAQPVPDPSHPTNTAPHIKEETGEDDQCFVIDSEDDDGDTSDNSKSNTMPQFLPNLADAQLVPTQGWPSGDMQGGSFSDPDMLAAAQQFGKGGQQAWSTAQFDMSQLSGASNMSFASPGTSQQLPSDSSARGETGKYCRICKRSYRQLALHYKEVHQKVRQHVCPVCGEAFSRKQSLLIHQSRLHLPKKFTCDICQKAFGWKIDFERHVHAHRLQM